MDPVIARLNAAVGALEDRALADDISHLLRIVHEQQIVLSDTVNLKNAEITSLKAERDTAIFMARKLKDG
jgi:hypothetical protein